MQRTANPCTPVRFRPQPPYLVKINKTISIIFPSEGAIKKKVNLLARVVELVDTRDLKSLEGNFVPVQVRLWAPFH